MRESIQEDGVIRVDLHHWQGSFPMSRVARVVDAVSDFCEKWLKVEPEWMEAGGLNGYQASFRWDELIVVAFDRDGEFAERVHNNKAGLTFRGSFFDALAYESYGEFAELLEKLDADVTRFDEYAQDVGNIVSVYEVFQAYRAGCCRGFRTRRYIEQESNGVSTGETLELGNRGNRGSGKFLRIYDKRLESKGQDLGVRWELEWSGKRAKQAWALLVTAGFAPSVLAGQVFGGVDWIEPTEDQHRDRWQRLEWYQTLLDGVERVFVKCATVKTDIQRKMGWVSESVSGSLAYIQAFLRYVDGCDDGFEGFIGLMSQQGRGKLRRSHYEQLAIDIKAFRKRGGLVGYEPTAEQIEADFEGRRDVA